MSWSRDEVDAFLAERPWIGRLATVSADGEPHVVPVWLEMAGGDLHVHAMEETRKVADIRATGRFGLAVDKEEPPYKGVSLVGRARVAGADEMDWRALVTRLCTAYLGPEAGPGFAEVIRGLPGEHVTVVLTPESWEAWDYSRA